MEMEETWRGQRNLKMKNKIRGIMLFDFKIYYKTTTEDNVEMD